jgi:thiamine biosynthesis lipoprotein
VTALSVQRRVVECMGTVFSLDIRPPSVDEQVIDEAVAWLHWVDRVFSTYQADSEISRLARGEVAAGDCEPEVAEILRGCESLALETDGYFSAHAKGALDPSGLVKGWAIERASDLLAGAGSTNHCVNGGGDVQCAGDALPGRPWRVGIAHPLRPGALAGVAVGSPFFGTLAVATSGTAERGAHVVDPHTGLAPDEFASVTVVGTRLAGADAYATAAFAMGASAYEWLEQLDGYQAFTVATDGSTWATSGWRS